MDLNPLIHDLAQFLINLHFVQTVDPSNHKLQAAPHVALILVRPFYKLKVPAAFS